MGSFGPSFLRLGLLFSWGIFAHAQDFSNNSTSVAPTVESDRLQCQPGLLIPVWEPLEGLSGGDVFARALIYFLALCYLFLGVSIIADRFMASIEVITSKEKEVTVKRPNGENQIIVVRVWNETVANLTLMALGSSAPEIMLSIIEIYAKDFEAGELGPGTIVGSAAFNLFIIIGLCVWVIPKGEVRKIKHLRVFFITATWSIFAYIWLYFIISMSSEGVVEIWEAVLTFLFFPATVGTAYIADRRLLIYKYLSKEYRLNRRGVVVETEGKCAEDMELAKGDDLKTLEDDAADENVREFEEHRREYIHILKELRRKHPNADMETLESMAREEVLNRGPKSRAFYRIQATRKLTGGGNLMRRALDRGRLDVHDEDEAEGDKDDDHVTKVFFDPGHYTVMENVGDFALTVTREGGDPALTILVDYKTEDGTANAGSDYEAAEGTLVFHPGDRHQQITLTILDDDVFEEDEHFYVKLHNLRVAGKDGKLMNGTSGKGWRGKEEFPAILETPSVATVMILDDDHCGIFNFPEANVEIVESVGTYELKVVRWSGARGTVAVPYKTIEGTGKPSKDYEMAEGEVIFSDNETEQFIPIQIIEEDSYEKDVLFYVELGEPHQILGEGDDDYGNQAENEDEEGERSPPIPSEDMTEEQRIALLGKPRLGETTRCQIRIKESKEFKNTVDKLLQRANASLLVGTSSWKEQFIEAVTVSAGGDDEGDDDESEPDGEKEEKLPSCGDYVMHFITLFWKILFAFVPPTDYWSGWLCFTVAILWIGILTAVIGDVASHFGCTIRLKDSVTAISLVALGTSVPDTFASKVAAVQDRYADASVGNVTGSNAVNVFLGIGLAWSLAAIVHWFKGSTFRVDPGNLAFSVTIFCSGAVVAIIILLLRRSKKIGGELGGPAPWKNITTLALVALWLFYVIMSTLEAYDYIEGF